MSLAEARTLAAERERSYFVQTGDPRLTRYREGGEPGDTQIAVNSSYFLVRGQVTLDRASTRLEALVRRSEANTPIRVLWQREL
jgi:type II secretory pathway component PulK